MKISIPALALFLLLSGCAVATPAVRAASAIPASPTAIPLPTPTLLPAITIQDVDSQYPNGVFQFGQPVTNLKAGSYLVFPWDYYSLKGSKQGHIGSYENFMPSPAGFTDHSMTSDIVDPEMMVASATTVLVDNGTTKIYRIDNILIWSFRLQTGKQHVWKVVFVPESGFLCTEVSVSPNHTWIAGNCRKGAENYLYFVNIQKRTVETLNSDEHSCSISTKYPETHWNYFSWSPDDKWLSATCDDGSEALNSCLVSPISGEFACPLPQQYYSPVAWSPDSTKVALLDQGSLLVTDRSCLQDIHKCPEYLRSPTMPQALGGASWDETGNNIVWSTYDISVGQEGPATISIANLITGDRRKIAGPAGANVKAISPDEKWIVLSNHDGWMLLSMNGQILRRLPRDADPFLGWLVVP